MRLDLPGKRTPALCFSRQEHTYLRPHSYLQRPAFFPTPAAVFKKRSPGRSQDPSRPSAGGAGDPPGGRTGIHACPGRAYPWRSDGDPSSWHSFYAKHAGGTTVVVTSGVGMSLAPVRYHAPAEVTTLLLATDEHR